MSLATRTRKGPGWAAKKAGACAGTEGHEGDGKQECNFPLSNPLLVLFNLPPFKSIALVILQFKLKVFK